MGRGSPTEFVEHEELEMARSTMTSGTDQEIQAMQACSRAIDGVSDTEVQRRIIRWLNEKYNSSAVALSDTVSMTSVIPDQAAEVVARVATTGYPNFSDFYDAANPSTDKERALVAAYWLQFGPAPAADFAAQPANALLKDVGHAVDNSTLQFHRLRSMRPSLVVQVKKSGKSRQSRKTYKATFAGKRYVERMLRGERADEGA